MTTIRTNSFLFTLFAALAFLSALLIGAASASAAITTTLDFGARGDNVIQLQTYLATNASIYPEGLVTGYFGALTRTAVERFQTAQGIVSSGTPATTGYGRVGPQTMARINALMGNTPPPSNVNWDTVPIQSFVSVQPTGTTATFSWTTNEPTMGQVFWSGSQIQADEATGPRQTPFVSGTLATDGDVLRTSHVVVVSGLQPNTTYYYLVRSIDSGSNITMIWPTSFRTGN